MYSEGFFISKLLGEAWSLFKKNWLTFYMVMILPTAIGFVYSMLSSSLPTGIISFVVGLAYFVFQLVVGMGVTHMMLKFVRGEKINFTADILAKKDRLVDYVIGMIMMIGVVIGGLILLIIPGLYWGLKYMFVPYLIIDKGNKPSEAFKNSAKMTEGIKWDLVGFMMASAILIYAGILALLVGVFVTGAVATIAYVLLYERLTKRLTLS
jgi:hypothetical protein